MSPNSFLHIVRSVLGECVYQLRHLFLYKMCPLPSKCVLDYFTLVWVNSFFRPVINWKRSNNKDNILILEILLFLQIIVCLHIIQGVYNVDTQRSLEQKKTLHCSCFLRDPNNKRPQDILSCWGGVNPWLQLIVLFTFHLEREKEPRKRWHLYITKNLWYVYEFIDSLNS